MKVFLAVPVNGLVPFQFAASLAAIHLTPFRFQLSSYEGGTIGRARNELTASFLASDCTHLLFVDSDIAFTLPQLNRLLGHSLPVVGGCYFQRKTGDSKIVMAPSGDVLESGLVPVEWIGAGFLLIAREVFNSLDAEQFENERGETRRDFWPCGIIAKDGKRLYCSEDVGFFRLCRLAGIQPMADTGIIVKHIGAAEFPTLEQMARLT